MKNILTLLTALLFTLAGAKAAATLTFIGQGWVSQNKRNFISTENGYQYFAADWYSQNTPRNTAIVEFNINNYQTSWNVQFGAPTGQVLTLGTYIATKYSPGHTQAFMNLYGDGRAWSEINGWFKVLEIEWGANNVVSKLAVDFEIFQNPLSWAGGSVRMDSNVPIGAIPEPGAPILMSTLILFFWRRIRHKKP